MLDKFAIPLDWVREHFRKMKKPKKFNTFLYHYFKSNVYSPGTILIQPIEKNYI